MELPSFYNDETAQVRKPESYTERQEEMSTHIGEVLEAFSTPETPSVAAEFNACLSATASFLGERYASSEYIASESANLSKKAAKANTEAGHLAADAAQARAKGDKEKAAELHRKSVKQQRESSAAATQSSDILSHKAWIERKEQTSQLMVFDLYVKVIDRLSEKGVLEGTDTEPPTLNAKGDIELTANQEFVYAELNKIIYGTLFDEAEVYMERSKGTTRDHRGVKSETPETFAPNWDGLSGADLKDEQERYMENFAVAYRAKLLFMGYDSASRTALSKIDRQEWQSNATEFLGQFDITEQLDREFPKIPEPIRDPGDSDDVWDWTMDQYNRDVSRQKAARKLREEAAKLARPSNREIQQKLGHTRDFTPIEHESSKYIEETAQRDLSLELSMLDAELVQADIRDQIIAAGSDKTEIARLVDAAKDAWYKAFEEFGYERQIGNRPVTRYGLQFRDYKLRFDRLKYEIGDYQAKVLKSTVRRFAGKLVTGRTIKPQTAVSNAAAHATAPNYWNRPKN